MELTNTEVTILVHLLKTEISSKSKFFDENKHYFDGDEERAYFECLQELVSIENKLKNSTTTINNQQ